MVSCGRLVIGLPMLSGKRVANPPQDAILMPHSFRETGALHKWWGGPPGPRGTPPSRSFFKVQVLPNDDEPARGPAADEGGRPTFYASARSWDNYAAS